MSYAAIILGAVTRKLAGVSVTAFTTEQLLDFQWVHAVSLISGEY